MYSNVALRQWFIGVKSSTDKQENRLRRRYTDFKGRQTKFAPYGRQDKSLRRFCAAVGGSDASSRRSIQGAFS